MFKGSFWNAVAVVQWLSRVQIFATPGTAARQATLPITISWSLLRLMSIKSVMPSTHLNLSFSSCLQFSLASGSFLEGLRQFRARFWGERREGNLKSLDSYFMRELNCNEALWSPNMSQFHRQITGLEGWCSAPLASPVHDWNPRSFSSELNLHLAVRTILFSWQTLEAFV